MTQGGASGSPVFFWDTGKVLGVLYAGLHDLEVSIGKRDLYRVPTNISYVVPSHYIVNSMKELLGHPDIKLPEDTLSLDEMLARHEVHNVFEKCRGWILKEIKPEAETGRIREYTRLQPQGDE